MVNEELTIVNTRELKNVCSTLSGRRRQIQQWNNRPQKPYQLVHFKILKKETIHEGLILNKNMQNSCALLYYAVYSLIIDNLIHVAYMLAQNWKRLIRSVVWKAFSRKLTTDETGVRQIAEWNLYSI